MTVISAQFQNCFFYQRIDGKSCISTQRKSGRFIEEDMWPKISVEYRQEGSRKFYLVILFDLDNSNHEYVENFFEINKEDFSIELSEMEKQFKDVAKPSLIQAVKTFFSQKESTV